MRPRLGLNEQHTFVRKQYTQDTLGQIHTRFNQYYKGVRVWGGEAITHMDAQGRDLPLTSTLRKDINIEVTPALSRAAVLKVAEADLGSKGPFAYEPAVELVIYPETSREILSARAHLPQAKLNATDMVERVQGYVLAYYIRTALENPGDTRHTDYLVNANTGAIIEKWDSLPTGSALGTGKSQYSGTVNLNTNSLASGFELRDPTRPVTGGNTVNNLNHGTSGTGTVYLDSDNTWGDGANFKEDPEPTTSANGQTAAVDAAYGIQVAWDMYRNVFGHNGIDGLGTPTYARVHYDSAYDNAFYSDQCLCVTYGDGTKLQTLTPLDIAVHEFSHGVCSNTAGLIYSKESGGLNEANSDIMGAMAEFYARGAGGQGSAIPDTGGTWTQGEQATTPEFPLKMRFLYKPSKDGKSADAWSPTLKDLDVHYSSGPMNRAFYFLSQGATTGGETSSTYLPQGMTGIGNDKAAKIWFRALTTYMPSGSDYVRARIANIQAVRDLFPLSGPEEIAVWNAFAAINVGAPWSGPDAPPAVTVSASGTQGNLTFCATASDDKGVVKVDFLLDGAVVGTAATPPYCVAFDSLKEDDGVHTLTARATDTTGQFADATTNFTLANGQRVRNGSFEKGYGVGWSNTSGVQIGAILGQTAYDGTKMAKLGGLGSRVSMGLYQTLTLPAEATSARLSYALHVETKESLTGAVHDTLAVQLRDGTGTVLKTLATHSDQEAAAGYKVHDHDLSAYQGRTLQLYFLGAEDAGAATSFVLDKVYLNVKGGGVPEIDKQPPGITVSVAGSSGMIGFSADAKDNVKVTQVEFYVDGKRVGTVASPPYTLEFDSRTLENRSHTLTGKAYDAAGNVGESLPVTFPVRNDDAESPVISVSGSGTSGTVTFSAEAKDNVGVVKVEFLVDGALIGTLIHPPYTLGFEAETLGVGRHTLLGKAYDAAGNIGTSLPFPFDIIEPVAGNDLILNGGFELGAGNWSGNGRIGSFANQPPYEGKQCAWLGGMGFRNTAELYQTVAIPAAARSATLSFALHIDSAEKSGWLRYDTAVVEVRDSAGTSVLKTLASYSNLDRNAGYAVKSFDLGSFKGRSVQIRFKAIEDLSYQTSFVFDKVSLSIQ